MGMLKHALDYAAQGFRVFPVAPNTKNKPMCKWANEATTDAKQITKWWTQYPKANIGFAAGLSGYAVVDVDIKDGRNGLKTLAELEVLEGHKLTETRMQRTPSGGLQYVYRGELATTQNAIGRHLYADDNQVSNIDTRGIGGAGGGYVLLPPSITADDPATHTKRGMYEWINGANRQIETVPAWVVEECGRARIPNSDQTFAIEPDQQANINDYIHYLKHDAPLSIEGQGGERALLLTAARGKDYGLSVGVTADLIDKYYNMDPMEGGKCEPTWSFASHGPDSLPAKVRNAFRYCHELTPGSLTGDAEFAESADEDAREIAELESKATASRIGRDGVDNIASDKPRPTPGDESEKLVAERTWTYNALRTEWVYITTTSRFVLRANPNISLKKETFDDLVAYTVAARPKPVKRPSHYLFNEPPGRAIKRAMIPVYRPGHGEFVTDSGVLNYNFYRPSDVVPAQGDTAVWNEHLAYLFPDETERGHVLNWCAWFLQNIERKPKHCLLIAGHVQGTGKSFISEVLSEIIGRHNVSALGPAELSSSFNRWALTSKLLVIEELRGLDKREIAQKLHPLITQVSIPINNKGEQTFTTDNCFGMLPMTNEDAAISLDNTDRRYLVVRTNATPREQVYYQKLYGLLKDKAAVAAIAYELQHRDLQGYDGQARAPETQAKQDMIEAGRSDFEQWLFEQLGNSPFDQQLISIQHDVIDMLPGRFKAGNNTSLTRQVQSFLKHHCKGESIQGQHTLSNGHRVRLWALDGKGGILKNMSVPARAALYEAKKKNERKQADAESARDFSDAE